MRSEILHPPAESRRFYLALGLMIALAWGLLAAWQRSAYAELLGHEALEHHHFPFAWQLAAFMLSWSLMTVAMMLPVSLPMLLHIAQPDGLRTEKNLAAGTVILGYLAPWILVGLLLYLGDSFLHRMAEPEAPLAAFSGLIAPAILMAAGLYQFTPAKRRCTSLCRSPHTLLPQGDPEKLSVARSLQQGLRLGAYCVGSCGSLMLLMFALGHHRLDWMLALGLILAAERLAPWGDRLTRWVGLLLVLWASLWVLISLSPLA
jgi:predicted metal-binding membrane protein